MDLDSLLNTTMHLGNTEHMTMVMLWTPRRIFGTDVDGTVEDAVDLTQKLAQSRSVHDCYTDQMFRYAFGEAQTLVTNQR